MCAYFFIHIQSRSHKDLLHVLDLALKAALAAEAEPVSLIPSRPWAHPANILTSGAITGGPGRGSDGATGFRWLGWLDREIPPAEDAEVQ